MGVQLTSHLIQATLEGRCPYVWFHVANEGTSKNGHIKGARLRAQGKWAGVYDYIFIAEDRSFALELKVTKGRLSEPQKIFKQWCTQLHIPHAEAYSLQEAIDILNEHMIVHKFISPHRNEKKIN